jgi:hypothetical protein
MCRRLLLLPHSQQQGLFCQQLYHDHHLVILAQVEVLVLAQVEVPLLLGVVVVVMVMAQR